MTEKDTASIIEKIMKLMTMAERGTTNEREVAYFKAQALMAKYHIDHDELFPKDSDKVIEVEVRLNVKTLLYLNLATIIANNFRCKLFVRHANMKYIVPVFYGLEVDATIASEIFKDAYKYAKHESTRVASYYNYHKGNSIGVKGDWLYGFVTGLNEGFNKQITSSDETALMVVIPKSVLDGYANIKFGEAKINFNKLNGNNNSKIISAGYENGLSFSSKRKQSVLDVAPSSNTPQPCRLTIHERLSLSGTTRFKSILISDPCYDNSVNCRFSLSLENELPWVVHFEAVSATDPIVSPSSGKVINLNYIEFHLLFTTRGYDHNLIHYSFEQPSLNYPDSLKGQSFTIGMDSAEFGISFNNSEGIFFQTGTDGYLGTVTVFKAKGDIVAISFVGSIDSNFAEIHSFAEKLLYYIYDVDLCPQL